MSMFSSSLPEEDMVTGAGEANAAQLGLAEGLVFDIQHFSIHDGPGIRTTVFLKGCPLACLWCQNPESQSGSPQILTYAERCVGCGACAAVCPRGAIELREGRAHTDRDLCTGEGACVAACQYEARLLVGRRMTAGEVLTRVQADTLFYERSGGGVTLSGGEPLAQPSFARALLQLCREAGLHTAVDTCGYASWSVARAVLSYADLVLFDFKHMDPGEHQILTGVSNEVVLQNARRIRQELRLPMLARIPVIPGCNDDLQNLRMTAQFIAEELGVETPVHLHPYHRLGEGKAAALGRPPVTVRLEPPSTEAMERALEIFASAGLEAVIGG